MQYITGVHALNLPCSLETCGDWHTSAIQWHSPKMAESDGSIWGEYGIEQGKYIPEHNEAFAVANHIRALLDLLYDGKFSVAQGMNRDFICNDTYTKEIFEQVWLMKGCFYWPEISRFMHKEYGRTWRLWVAGKKHTKM